MERLEFKFDDSDNVAFFINEEEPGGEIEIGIARNDGVMETLIMTGIEPQLLHKWLGDKLYPVQENE